MTLTRAERETLGMLPRSLNQKIFTAVEFNTISLTQLLMWKDALDV